MNKKQLFLPILILMLTRASCAKEDRPVVSEQPPQDEEIRAETYIAPSAAQTHGLYTESDLGYTKVGYFYKVDLNNDGKEEIVEVTEPYKLFTNVLDGVWGDDTGAVIRILKNKRKCQWD